MERSKRERTVEGREGSSRRRHSNSTTGIPSLAELPLRSLLRWAAFTEARIGRLPPRAGVVAKPSEGCNRSTGTCVAEGRQPPHFGEELSTIIHFWGEGAAPGHIPFSAPSGDPVWGSFWTSFGGHFGAHFGPRIELWSEGEIEHKREPKLGSS